MTPNTLPPEKYAELQRQLDEVDRKFEESIAANRADKTMTEEERNKRYVSLKNGNASRKSQIRKQFGVSLRLREKDKRAMKAQGLKPEYPKNENYKASSRASLNGSTPQTTPHYIDPHYSSSSYDSPADGLPKSTTNTPPPTSSFTPLNRPSAGALPRIGASGNHEGFSVFHKDNDPKSVFSPQQMRPTSFSTNPSNPLKRRRTSTPSNASRSRPSSSQSNRIVPMNPLPPTERFEALSQQMQRQIESENEKEIIEVLSSSEESQVDGVNSDGGSSGGERRGSGMAKRGGREDEP